VPGLHRLGTFEHEWTPLGFRCLVDPPDAVPLEVRAGSIAVFSSLTPHRTGPNRTTEVRKAYILQYAPDGAIMHPREGSAVACNVPERQFSILVRGAAI
jgi:ectoine hydroxylase-related dioxygenase (phytanoyl-CoA dioxygenase family)